MIAAALAKRLLSHALSLHPFYVSRPRLWSAQLWEIDARIALSPERRFCYVRIPKSANTAVISTLFHHDTGSVPGRHVRPKRRFRRPSTLPLLTPAALDTWYCFSFVRNPYHRLLSAYLSKLVARGAKPPYREIGARIRQRYGGGRLSFGAFCSYLADGGLYGNPHWFPQCSFVDAVGFERLDFVGRVETMERDVAHVMHAIFGRADARTGKTSPPTGAAQRVGEHYDDTARGIVRELYRADFERFGYDPAAPA
jgi:hypothetical protein